MADIAPQHLFLAESLRAVLLSPVVCSGQLKLATVVDCS